MPVDTGSVRAGSGRSGLLSGRGPPPHRPGQSRPGVVPLAGRRVRAGSLPGQRSRHVPSLLSYPYRNFSHRAQVARRIAGVRVVEIRGPARAGGGSGYHAAAIVVSSGPGESAAFSNSLFLHYVEVNAIVIAGPPA